MCRFVAYKGKKTILLQDLLTKPINSLKKQSKHAREGKLGINADGFGIGWYNHHLDNKPGVYKSIQPAWNDENLIHLASKIQATCFIGHVRASTVGEVSMANCHPFNYQKYLFAHNGTIHGFDEVKRTLQTVLSDETFSIIKGNTDSENFFALLIHYIKKENSADNVSKIVLAYQKAITTIKNLCDEHNHLVRLNTILTDGKQLIATRYISDINENSISLYYSQNSDKCNTIIASEPLSDDIKWHEIPINHMLIIDSENRITFQAITS